MTGRETKPAPQHVDYGCIWSQVIYVSKDDQLTDQTARAILSHNETYVRFCGDPRKPKQ